MIEFYDIAFVGRFERFRFSKRTNEKQGAGMGRFKKRIRGLLSKISDPLMASMGTNPFSAQVWLEAARRKRGGVVQPIEPQQNAAQQAPANDNLHMEVDNHYAAAAAPASSVVAVVPDPLVVDVIPAPPVVAEEDPAPPVVVVPAPLVVDAVPAPVLAVVPPPPVYQNFQEMWEQVEARVREITRERIADIVLRTTAEVMEQFQNGPTVGNVSLSGACLLSSGKGTGNFRIHS
jgi:hypothetical protein